MKNIFKWYGFVVFIVVTQTSIAQQSKTTKPTLFTNFPSTIICTADQLSNLFAVAQGQYIKLSLPGKLVLEGTVKNKISKYGKIETMTVQLPSFGNILFSVTKSNDENNNAIYTAHLFNSKYADGYELKRNGKNSYQFEKIEMEKMLPACNQ
jgi:hypothetical protein